VRSSRRGGAPNLRRDIGNALIAMAGPGFAGIASGAR
jgi:hypothetical protein